MTSMALGLLMIGQASWLGGVHYIVNIARGLRYLPDQVRPKITLFAQRGIDQALLSDIAHDVDEVHIVRSDSLWTTAKEIRVLGYGTLLAPRLSELARQYSIDLLFPVQESLGSRYPIAWMGWIPDFQHRIMPEHFGWLHRIARDVRFRRLIRDADMLLLSSKVAADDLADFLETELPSKARTLPFTVVPVESWYQVDSDHVRHLYGLPKRYLLVANQFWAHKNHWDVFKAAKIAYESGRQVEIVCTGDTSDPRYPGYFKAIMRFVEEHRLGSAIRILGLVPRLHQIAIMRSALAVLQPSRFEGWSTVIEEARALGKPIIASDIPVHLEQAHPQASYFTPGDPNRLAQLIISAWEAGSPGLDLRRESLARRDHKQRIEEFATEFNKIARDAIYQ